MIRIDVVVATLEGLILNLKPEWEYLLSDKKAGPVMVERHHWNVWL